MTTKQVAHFLSKKMYEFAEADADKDEHEHVRWTPDQVFAYRSWLINYLKSHKVARSLAMKDASKNKIESFVDNWIKLYGFKLALNKETDNDE